MNLENLKEVLFKCYSKDLCYPKVKDDWNIDNSCFGMCAITSLVVNDYFGGIICKMDVNGISHYFNLMEGDIVDLTSDQFEFDINYKNYIIVDRKNILTADTLDRYDMLKKRVMNELLKQIDEEIYLCDRCNKLVEKFPNNSTVYLGKDQTIVLIGEAPANNGWRKSHKLWTDVNGKTLPSGVVLQKLFDIIDRDIFETTFLESVKCFPLERKNLKICSKNCKCYMIEQLKILKPKLIITLGEFPTRNLLPFNFVKFSDVVGDIYEVDNYKVLPIYHPSPVSPMSYKGNVSIFEKI